MLGVALWLVDDFGLGRGGLRGQQVIASDQRPSEGLRWAQA